MTETLYLIAHKVRGQPAFDIAIRDGEDWIMPTTGCKVYPYDYMILQEAIGDWDPRCPNPWRDYQPTNIAAWDSDYGEFLDYKRAKPGAGANLIAALGITRPQSQPLVRRKL